MGGLRGKREEPSNVAFHCNWLIITFSTENYFLFEILSISNYSDQLFDYGIYVFYVFSQIQIVVIKNKQCNDGQ